MDEQDAKTELQYWLQLIGDCQKELSDLNSINDCVGIILHETNSLIPFILTNDEIYSSVETIIMTISPIQATLLAAMARNEQTIRLIEGRLKMVREELDI